MRTTLVAGAAVPALALTLLAGCGDGSTPAGGAASLPQETASSSPSGSPTIVGNSIEYMRPPAGPVAATLRTRPATVLVARVVRHAVEGFTTSSGRRPSEFTPGKQEGVYTRWEIEVEDVWRSDCAVPSSVVALGGTLDGFTTHAEGWAGVEDGARVVLILQRAPFTTMRSGDLAPVESFPATDDALFVAADYYTGEGMSEERSGEYRGRRGWWARTERLRAESRKATAATC